MQHSNSISNRSKQVEDCHPTRDMIYEVSHPATVRKVDSSNPKGRLIVGEDYFCNEVKKV
jgi:hypothetical protein